MSASSWIDYGHILRIVAVGMAAAALMLLGAVACWFEVSRAGGAVLAALALLTVGGTVAVTGIEGMGKRDRASPLQAAARQAC